MQLSKLVKIESGEILELDSLPDTRARAIGWNQSANLLAVGDNEAYLTFFDKKGIFLKSIDTEQKDLISLDWHPEINLIVTVGERITIYNYETGSLKNIEDRGENVLMLLHCLRHLMNGLFLKTVVTLVHIAN